MILKLILNIILVLSKNYYDVLGISRNASNKEIKKAYKKLTIKYHPDRVPHDQKEKAKEKFSEIQNIYEILGDEELRSVYDRYGESGVKEAMEEKRNHEQYQQRRKMQEEEYKRRTREHDILHNTEIEKINLENLSQFYRRINIWIIIFYKPEEDNLPFLKNVLLHLLESSNDIYNVNRIDCDEEEELCNEFNVYNTPKLFIYKSNSNNDPVEIDYLENKNEKILISKIKNSVFNLLEDFVRIVNSNNYIDFIKSSKKMKILLFSERKTTPPILKVLSKEFKTYIDFGIVKVNYEKELPMKFSIKNNPSIVVIKDAGNYVGELYEDEINKSKISKFLRDQLHEYNTKSTNLNLVYSYKELKKSDICGLKEKDFCLFLISDSDKLAHQLNENFGEDSVKFINLKLSEINLTQLLADFNQNVEDKNNIVLILRSKRRKGLIYEKEVNYENIKSFIEFYLSGGLNYKPFNKNIREYFNKESEL